jgi:formate dehydrogenase subunit gamma
MSTSTPPPALEAVAIARSREDVAVGEEIVRHRLSSRALHWTGALFFFLSLVSGLPIWTPVFGWMAPLLGGLSMCRVVHPWAGLLFSAASLAMFVHWGREMRLRPEDRAWLRMDTVVGYLRHTREGAEVGKYNGGQKLFFYAVSLGALGLFGSGVVLWEPTRFPQWARLASILLHEVAFILFTVAIVFHVYLATAALPGTFAAMTRGTVTRGWARVHHPRWYREVTGEERGGG